MRVWRSQVTQGAKLVQRFAAGCTAGGRDAWGPHWRRGQLCPEVLDGRVPWLVFILEFTRILAQVVELRLRCFNELKATTADSAEWRPSEAHRIIRFAKDHPVALFLLCELATQRVFGKRRRGSDVEQI